MAQDKIHLGGEIRRETTICYRKGSQIEYRIKQHAEHLNLSLNDADCHTTSNRVGIVEK